MAESRILFPEFRDEQGASRYPFVDAATLIAINETMQLEPGTFLDASFFCSDLGPRVYLSRVVIDTQTITLYVGDETQPDFLSATYDITDVPTNGALVFFDQYGRPCGTLLASDAGLGKFNALMPGDYEFAQTATEFVATTVIPTNIPGVRGLTFGANFIYGDMWLIGDAGVVIRKEANTESTIRIDVVGEPLFDRFVCEPLGDFPPVSYLKTINGCGPDRFGNFIITATNKNVADPILRVVPQNDGLVISVVGRSNV